MPILCAAEARAEPEVLAHMKAKSNGLYLYRSPKFLSAEHGDKPRERFPSTKLSESAVRNWLNSKAQPLVGLYSSSTKERYSGGQYYAPADGAAAFSGDTMSEFARAFLAGELTPYEKPEPEPAAGGGDEDLSDSDDDYGGGDEDDEYKDEA